MKNLFEKARYGVVVPLMFAAGSAIAAVPPEVKTAIDEAKTDSVAVAGMVLVVIAAIFAIMMIRRVLR